MNPFASTLKTMYDRLDLPQPEKSRILLEIASDMEDCYRHLTESGLGEKEAVRQTEARFRPDASNLQALTQIHTPVIQKWMDRFSRHAQSRWEKTLLLTLLCMVLAFSGPDLASMRLIRDAGIWAWPTAGFALTGILVFLIKVYRLSLKRKYDVRRLRDGTLFLLFLGGAGVMTGLTGVCTETIRFAEQTLADMDRFTAFAVDALVRNSAAMTMGILNAIAMGICWFGLNRKIEEIEQSEIHILLKME